MKKIQIKIKSNAHVTETQTTELTEIPVVIEQKWEEKYGEATFKKMKEQLKRVNREVFNSPYFIIDNYLNNYAQVIEFIEKQKSSVAKVLCNTVRQAIDCYDVKNTIAYKAYYDCFGRIVKKAKEQPFTEVEEKEFPQFRWIDVEGLWKHLHNLFKNNQNAKLNNYQVYLLFSLYYLLPPLRPQDWINAKIVRLSPDTDLVEYAQENGNIIDMTTHNLVVADYKTVLTHGVRVIPFNGLSEEFGILLADIIEKYLVISRNASYLFTTKKGQPIAEQNITKIFAKALINDKPTNATELRNLFISEKIIDENLSLDRRKRLAYIMGHTIQTQTFIYSKYSQFLHKKT